MSFGAWRPGERAGFTYLEVQVALVLFMIAISGLAPLAVIQSRQLQRLESRFSPGETHYLVPSTDEWSRKLGAVAAVSNAPSSPPPPSPMSIDNGGPGYSEIHACSHWALLSDSNAMNGHCRIIEENHGGNYAVWTFDSLEPGQFEVFATYPHRHWLANNAPYRIYDGATHRTTTRVNQESPPSGNWDGGRQWDSLGVVQITGQTLVVQLGTDAEDDVAADGVRITPRRNTVTVDSVSKSSDTSNMSAVVHVDVVVN